MDQLATVKHTQILFSYLNIESEGNITSQRKVADDRFEMLKTSLSETLTYLYPLAGRVKDSAIIECEGVEFYEARAHGFLVEILEQPANNSSIQQFVPPDDDDKDNDDDDDDAELGSGFLLKVQVNLIDCAGLVIGVSLYHNIADASTISLFMKAWSCITVGCINESMLPKYIWMSLPFHRFSDCSIT